MTEQISEGLVKHFKAPQKSFGEIDAEGAAELLAAAADVSLIVDSDGVILDIAVGNDALTGEGFDSWLGKAWADTVTIESRAKVQSLIEEASGENMGRARQVNYASSKGSDIPIVYSAIRINGSELQQRLLNAQNAMEREYTRLRQLETRYRLLFQIAGEAVLVLDEASEKVIDANPQAKQVLQDSRRKLEGTTFSQIFGKPVRDDVKLLLERVRTTGRTEDLPLKALNGQKDYQLRASLFRQGNEGYFLIRISPRSDADLEAKEGGSVRSQVMEVVENCPDAFVVTEPDGRILTANRAFLDMTQVATGGQLEGEPLSRWLGRSGVDLNLLLASLKENGTVKNFSSIIQSQFGLDTEVEISAISVTDDKRPCLGFVMRDISQRIDGQTVAPGQIPRNPEELTELVGRTSLKNIIRETTDVIERLCIEAALRLTGDNRALAAEMLGLSRQSLYVKLRRHGIGDLNNSAE